MKSFLNNRSNKIIGLRMKIKRQSGNTCKINVRKTTVKSIHYKRGLQKSVKIQNEKEK